MSPSSPDPRYCKDGAGLRPRLRFLFAFGIRRYWWHAQPRWLRTWRLTRKDRRP